MNTKPTLPDDAGGAAVQAAIDRGSKLLLGELDRLLKALPALLAPLIAAEPVPEKRRAIIHRETQRVRNQIKTSTKAMVDKFGETEH